jgi:hypothetical protein
MLGPRPPPSYYGRMSDDADLLPERERARIRGRDRKVRGPKVIVDNAGLKKLTVALANKRRMARNVGAAPSPPRRRRPSPRIRRAAG